MTLNMQINNIKDLNENVGQHVNFKKSIKFSSLGGFELALF